MMERDARGHFLPKPSALVVAKGTFGDMFRIVRKGELLPADDPLVKAKPSFFAPYVAK
jgi:hypothetical protein